jgi:hypothetical protein
MCALRLLLLAAPLVAVALLVADSSPAHVDVSARKLPCTVLVARDRIISAPKLPRSVRDDAAGMNGGGVDRLICRDVTLDKRTDMTALVTRTANSGVTAWVVFRAKREWALSLARTNVRQCAVKTKHHDLMEKQPTTAGGFVHRRFHWDRKHKHFDVVRKWYTT